MNKKSSKKKSKAQGSQATKRFNVLLSVLGRVPVLGFVVSKMRTSMLWQFAAVVIGIAVAIHLILNVVITPLAAKWVADKMPEVIAVQTALEDQYPKKVAVADHTYHNAGSNGGNKRVLGVTIIVDTHITHDESMKIREKVCTALGEKAKNYDDVILQSTVEKRFLMFFSRDNKPGSIRCDLSKHSEDASKNKKPEPTESDFAPVMARSANSVVKIEAHGCGDGMYLSTGFVVAPHLLVLAAHGVAGTNEVYVRSGDRSYPAKVVVFDDTRDVAIVRVDGLAGTPLNLYKREALSISGERNGEKMLFAGYPGGGNFTSVFTTIAEEGMGGIFDASGTQHGLNIFMLETPIQPGNSGSPLIDVKGEVVGMVHGASLVTEKNGRGHVIPTEAFLEYVEQAKNLHTPVDTGVCAPIPGQ